MKLNLFFPILLSVTPSKVPKFLKLPFFFGLDVFTAACRREHPSVSTRVGGVGTTDSTVYSVIQYSLQLQTRLCMPGNPNLLSSSNITISQSQRSSIMAISQSEHSSDMTISQSQHSSDMTISQSQRSSDKPLAYQRALPENR